MTRSTTDAAAPAARSRAATRERLLDAARRVLVREGIQGASVEHICDQAGFTRGAFYSNFSSKDELVTALFQRERETLMATLSEAADPAGIAGQDPPDAVAAILDRFLVLQPPDRDWYLLHLEFELRGVRGDAGGDEFVRAWDEIMDDLLRVVDRALVALGLRLTIDPRQACLVLVGTWDAVVREALVHEQPVDTTMLRTTLPAMLLALTEPA